MFQTLTGWWLRRRRAQQRQRHFLRDYRRLVARKLREHPNDRRLALAQAIGAESLEMFNQQGDDQVAVLRAHGLANGMAIYDLGCGCGRTAQALQRGGWDGDYSGADVVPELVAELQENCPSYRAQVHHDLTIAAPDNSQHMVFHWSVFTHLQLEECYLYLKDSFRALRPGGRTVFSFLELESRSHQRILRQRIALLAEGREPPHLDTFLHRDWLKFFAADIGFAPPSFTEGNSAIKHPALWQAIAVMEKPGVSPSS